MGREPLPAPTDRLFIDFETPESMELLRFVDMSRADRYRAAVTADPPSRREVQGYLNFTMLRLDGAGSYPGAVVDELVRYLGDHTRIQAKIRQTHEIYFLSEELLKDPIHFLFPTARLGGDLERRTSFNLDEMHLLEAYLHSGGFLVIDAGGSADDRRFLNEVVALLHKLGRSRRPGVIAESPRSSADERGLKGLPVRYR